MFNKLADIINEVWTKISDFFSHFLNAFWDGIQSIGQKIVDGISHAISSFAGGLGLGGTGSGLFGGGGFLGLGFANGGAFGGSNVHAFASGGSFTNGVYNTPTPFMFANGSGFSNGIMGEAGSEAVMPLKRGADGSLGVRMYGGAANDSSSGAVNLLRAEIIQMRKDNYAGQLAIATATQKMARLMDRWEGGGSPPLRAAL
jgi:lambda family phage tail tape measure protein